MCTAISYKTGGRLFGRNLDVDTHYGEAIIITPRNFTLSFRKLERLSRHYAFIGAGIEKIGYPLYFDGVNEHGLCIAGLNFVGNARYFAPEEKKINITPFELIPYVLASFRNVSEAMAELGNLNLTDIPFSTDLPLAQLHWLVADKRESIVIEQTADGLRIYENPIGVLTNNPPFPFHRDNLSSYMTLTSKKAENLFSHNIPMAPYSNGLGAFGLPGDISSASRFVRAAFYAHNATKSTEKMGDVYQLFHILSSVEQIEGAACTDGGYERTDYSAVMDPTTATYYYRTYTDSKTHAVRLSSDDSESCTLTFYPMNRSYSVDYQN